MENILRVWPTILLLVKVLVLFLLLLKLELLNLLLLPDFLLILLVKSNLILIVLLLLESILKTPVVVGLTVEIVGIRRSLESLGSLGSWISILPLVIENVVLEVIPEFLLLALLLLLVKV